MTAKWNYSLQTAHKSLCFALRHIPGVIPGTKSTKYRGALSTLVEAADRVEQFTVRRGLSFCSDKFDRNASDRSEKISSLERLSRCNSSKETITIGTSINLE